MPETITEWEFTADVASKINILLEHSPDLIFQEARCEKKGKGSQKRADLTLLDKSGKEILKGEVKLPYRSDGGSPYNEKLVRDARSKAQRSQVKFFFTWNVNQCVLWETFPAKTPLADREYQSWSVTNVHQPAHMEVPSTQHAIFYKWLPEFLYAVDRILRGTSLIGRKTPDEKFVQALESALHMPILLNLAAIEKEYTKARFKGELDKWMREEQGWIIYDDLEGVRDNLERAARFSAYALLNKLVFHEALLRRYGRKLLRLEIPEHIQTGDDLRVHLEKFFHEAKRVTGDYETVFGEEHRGVGNRIPFYSDEAVSHWRELIEQIHLFDFSKIDYEIIGSLFELLIAPEERHKYGQYYTRPEVVDLINSFCIRTGEEKVMDPACGGGTFLVRAYARKRELAFKSHSERLADLYGIDVSHYAAHLTTINLATRDLVGEENYPQIARANFFDVTSGTPFLELPRRGAGKVATKGMGKSQHRDVLIPPLDAVIGNPPYVRQEDIPKTRNGAKNPQPGTKEYYRQLVKQETGAELSGRSDIHCYFWPHAFTFLAPDGYLCFLTSSQWLDVEYGFKLQEWILRHFEIVAIFESIDEPWFIGARVATTVTILRRQPNAALRMRNLVRFVQLRRPIAEILAHDGTTADMVQSVDDFRDEILKLTENSLNERFRVQLQQQGDLWREGVQLSVMMGRSSEEASDNHDVQNGSYYGGKWGVHLRAPDFWFDLLTRYGKHFSPLGEVSDIRFGVKSGKDGFFFPIDVTEEILQRAGGQRDYTDKFGVPEEALLAGDVRLVRCGEGMQEIRPIESTYLEPEIHSLMGLDTYVVDSSHCERSVILIPSEPEPQPYARQYIRWGEQQKFNEAPTCVGRETDERRWYDLTYYERPDIVLPKIQQYRFVSFLNPERLLVGSALLGLYDVESELVNTFAAILNSTLFYLSKIVYSRGLGNEGNIQLDVYSAKMMLVPNPYRVTANIRRRLEDAMEQIANRKVLGCVSQRRLRRLTYTLSSKQRLLNQLSDETELDMKDRRELDDAVLELIGIKSRKVRSEIIESLYGHLKDYFEQLRQKEEQAILNKSRARHRGQMRPAELAEQICQEIEDREPRWFMQYERNFLDPARPENVFDLPNEGEPELLDSMFDEIGVAFRRGKKLVEVVRTRHLGQAELVEFVAKTGVRGLVRFPYEEKDCRRVRHEYEKYHYEREQRLWDLIEARTADDELQDKIYKALRPLLNRER